MILFTDIQAHLAEVMPALQYIDEDWGQLDHYGNQPPVKFPCALVDCYSMAASHAGRRSIINQVGVVIRLADIRLSNSSAEAPPGQKKANHSFFDLMSDVIRNLHGYTGSPEQYGRLINTGQRQIKRPGGIRIVELTFSCLLINTDARKATIPVSDYRPKVKVENNE